MALISNQLLCDLRVKNEAILHTWLEFSLDKVRLALQWARHAEKRLLLDISNNGQHNDTTVVSQREEVNLLLYTLLVSSFNGIFIYLIKCSYQNLRILSFQEAALTPRVKVSIILLAFVNQFVNICFCSKGSFRISSLMEKREQNQERQPKTHHSPAPIAAVGYPAYTYYSQAIYYNHYTKLQNLINLFCRWEED